MCFPCSLIPQATHRPLGCSQWKVLPLGVGKAGRYEVTVTETLQMVQAQLSGAYSKETAGYGQRPESSLLPIRKLPEPIGLVPNKVTNLDIKMRFRDIGYIATGRQ